MVSDKKCVVQTPELLKNIRYGNTMTCSGKLVQNPLEKDWNRNLFIIMYFEASTKICIQRLVNCRKMHKFLCASWIMLLWWVSKLLESLFHNKNNSANRYIKCNESSCSDPSWALPAQGDCWRCPGGPGEERPEPEPAVSSSSSGCQEHLLCCISRSTASSLMEGQSLSLSTYLALTTSILAVLQDLTG